MLQGIKLFVYPVKDLARSKALYTTFLGVEPYADAAYYVGFRLADQEIGLDPNGHKSGMTGRWATGRWTTSERLCRCSWTPAHKYSKRSRMSVGVS